MIAEGGFVHAVFALIKRTAIVRNQREGRFLYENSTLYTKRRLPIYISNWIDNERTHAYIPLALMKMPAMQSIYSNLSTILTIQRF